MIIFVCDTDTEIWKKKLVILVVLGFCLHDEFMQQKKSPYFLEAVSMVNCSSFIVLTCMCRKKVK